MSEYNIQMNKYNALSDDYDQLYPKPMKHASTHAKDGSDPILPSSIGAYSKEETDTLLANKVNVSAGTGFHNSIYRGKYLGNSVTTEQYAAIKDGTFDDLYIGDYWTIGDINYRIAAFNYYYMSYGCYHSHVTLVPDAPMYNYKMNDTNTTTGGYVGSKMYTTGLNDAKTTINNAFGSEHILTQKQFLCNAVSNGAPSGVSWYDSTVELMTEQNVYGCKIFGAYSAFNSTKDKSQYPLFAFRPDLISYNNHIWLRDVASAANFCRIQAAGNADSIGASDLEGVRPAFSIKA